MLTTMQTKLVTNNIYTKACKEVVKSFTADASLSVKQC